MVKITDQGLGTFRLLFKKWKLKMRLTKNFQSRRCIWMKLWVFKKHKPKLFYSDHEKSKFIMQYELFIKLQIMLLSMKLWLLDSSFQLKHKHLKIFCYSQLVAKQVKGPFNTKDLSMVKYLEKAQQFLKKLKFKGERWKIIQIPIE